MRQVAELEAKCAELDNSLGRAERTIRALRDVGLALGSTLDLDQLLELILGKIAEILEADRATLYLLDEQRGRLLSRIMIGDEPRSIELPVGAGVAGHVAKFGQTIRIKDAYRDRRFSRSWDDLTGYRTRSILAAPMKNHVGRTIGVIQVLNKRAQSEGNVSEFSMHDEELLTSLATQAAISIDNSRLFLSVIQKNMQLVETKEQLEHRVSDLKLLFDLESAMARATTLEDLARAVLLEAARTCGAQAGGLMVDEGEDGVWLYFVDLASGKKGAVEIRRLAVKRGEGILGVAMRSGEAQHVAGGSPQRSNKRDHDGEAGPVSARLETLFGITVSSAVAMPLEGQDDEPIGALGLFNAERQGGFSQDARALLRLVSANASTALRLFLGRAEREKSDRLTSLGRLLSAMLHDLRTPMTIISGYVQLMATEPDDRTRQEHAKLVAKQFDIIGSMQREILEFARGERSIFIRKVYLNKFFADVEANVARELEGTKIKLVMQIEDKGTARFDEAKLLRVLHNLNRNAIEAMGDRGGTLTISARREGEDLVIGVADTGRGIPDEVQRKLFRTFVTSGKQGGTGLGLSIVKKIVEEHDGTISVESSAQGTKFTFRLPQTAATATSNRRKTTVDATGEGRSASGSIPAGATTPRSASYPRTRSSRPPSERPAAAAAVATTRERRRVKQEPTSP